MNYFERKARLKTTRMRTPDSIDTAAPDPRGPGNTETVRQIVQRHCRLKSDISISIGARRRQTSLSLRRDRDRGRVSGEKKGWLVCTRAC